MLVAFRNGKGVTLWKNFQVSGFLVSNNDLADAPPGPGDYGDYSHCAFQSGKFFPLWADNSNSTNDNPAENCSEDCYNFFDIYTRKIIVP